MKVISCFIGLSLFVSSYAAILPFLEPPRHDGIKRVCHLTAENYTTVLSAAEVAVVVFTTPQPTKQPAVCPTELDNFAEVSAQVLRKKNIIVCEASADLPASQQTPPSAVSQVSAGDVYIYKKGNGVPYYGRRSTPALLSFLFKVNGTQVNVITGKIDKIAFDAVQGTKVVGLFMQGTADYNAFEEAAAKLSPSVAFYVAFDRVVAKHLKLETVGQIHLIKPLEKTPIPCPQNPASAADIEAFIGSQKGAVLTKMNEHNLYDPQLLDTSRTLVLAIGEQASSFGGYFYHLVTKLVRNNTNNTDFEKLNIVWIEPQIFPTIHLMMEDLQTTLGIPNQLPAFGAVNITTMQSAWLNTAQLNTTSDKTSDERNLKILEDFLSSVINNTIVPVKIGSQSFVQMPASQVVAEGSDVLLECVIENLVGDCLWLRNGRNVGFNLARFIQYSWRGDQAAGDCSLKITGIQKGRDDGEWVCEVTGDAENPTITSSPAKIVVSGTAAKSEL